MRSSSNHSDPSESRRSGTGRSPVLTQDTGPSSLHDLCQHEVLSRDEEKALFSEFQELLGAATLLALTLPHPLVKRREALGQPVNEKKVAFVEGLEEEIAQRADAMVAYRKGDATEDATMQKFEGQASELAVARIPHGKKGQALFNKKLTLELVQLFAEIPDDIAIFTAAKAVFEARVENLTAKEFLALMKMPPAFRPSAEIQTAGIPLLQAANAVEVFWGVPAPSAAYIFETGNKCVSRLNDLKNEALLKNIKLIVKEAGRWSAHISQSELEEVGLLKFHDAVAGFDPKRNIKFSTYFVRALRQVFSREVQERNGKRGDYTRAQRDVLEFRSKYEKKHGFYPTLPETAEELGMSQKAVEGAIRILRRAAIRSFTDMNPDDTTSRESLYGKDAPPDEASANREESEKVHRAVRHLREPDRTVVSLRFGLGEDPPKTLEEIGALIGVSKERVRQIETRAKKTLRKIISQRYLPERTPRLDPDDPSSPREPGSSEMGLAS